MRAHSLQRGRCVYVRAPVRRAASLRSDVVGVGGWRLRRRARRVRAAALRGACRALRPLSERRLCRLSRRVWQQGASSCCPVGGGMCVRVWKRVSVRVARSHGAAAGRPSRGVAGQTRRVVGDGESVRMTNGRGLRAWAAVAVVGWRGGVVVVRVAAMCLRVGSCLLASTDRPCVQHQRHGWRRLE